MRYQENVDLFHKHPLQRICFKGLKDFYPTKVNPIFLIKISKYTNSEAVKRVFFSGPSTKAKIAGPL